MGCQREKKPVSGIGTSLVGQWGCIIHSQREKKPESGIGTTERVKPYSCMMR